MSKVTLDKPQIICHVEKSVNYSLFDCKWIPRTAKFVVMGSLPNASGCIQIYEISEGDVKLVKELYNLSSIAPLPLNLKTSGVQITIDVHFPKQMVSSRLFRINKNKAFRCGTFGASDIALPHIATGDFDGRLNIWDLEKPEVPLYSVAAHKEIINSIDGVGGQTIGCGAPEIVTGSRDGTVKVWDPRQKGKPVAIMEPESEDIKRDCWAVAFGNSYNSEQRAVASGYDNGDIKLFDLNKMTCRWQDNVNNGVCGLEFDRRDIQMNKLVATTLESKFHVYNMRVQHPTKGFSKLTEKAHKATIWMCRHLPQNREIFITGGSGSLCLWKYNYPEVPSKKVDGGEEVGCVGSLTLLQNAMLGSQPVAALDWSPDKQGLAVCSSYDQTFRVLIVTKLNLY